ncbi:uncharacterized protein LOC111245554 isoform X2 [Varroa destructor]|nr:uncharacterized protein LOC111245554 isoform X2 [Varroa destructor]
MRQLQILLFLVTLSLGPSLVEGHGRLMEPPSRSSMWRVGFKTPRNYNDNELFCGGFTRQMRNGMKCGVCGDPWDIPTPRPNEAGGKYATGQISRYYQSGQVIETAVELTANHRGHFQFRLCPVNDPKVVADDDCMAKYPLEIVEAMPDNPYLYKLPDRNHRYQVRVKLPSNLTCSQCVFQWTYTAGNNWGRCPDGVSRVGCGPQETFRGCSDIAIGSSYTTSLNHAGPPRVQHPSTSRPWKLSPNHGYGNKNLTATYWPKTKTVICNYKTTTYRPQSEHTAGNNIDSSRIMPDHKIWNTLPFHKPGLEKEEGLPMTPSETKMHGHYPEPTTRKPCATEPRGETTEIKNTSPQTRFLPKTARPHWNSKVTTSHPSNRGFGWAKMGTGSNTFGSSPKPSTTPALNSTTLRKATPIQNEIPSSEGSNKKKRCLATGRYAGSKKILEWCELNCLHAPYYCPKSHCSCGYRELL